MIEVVLATHTRTCTTTLHSPHTGISTLTETLCPLANNGQDIVICIPRGELTLSLTESVSGVIVCLVNRSQCNNLLLGEELYDAVLVQLWNVEISGRIEIAASINIYFGKFL